MTGTDGVGVAEQPPEQLVTVMVEVIKVVSSWSGQVIVFGQIVVVVYVYMVTSLSFDQLLLSFPQLSDLPARARPARAPKRRLLTILICVMVQVREDSKIESGSEGSSKTVAKES